MRIRFLRPYGTAARAYAPGDVADWPERDARRLVSAGVAALHVADPAPEPERTVASPGAERRRRRRSARSAKP